MIVIHMTLSLFVGFLFSYHLVFYPNVRTSLLEDWINIIFWFGQGLLAQYYLLHFFNEEEQGER
jgi:hypothetical protein